MDSVFTLQTLIVAGVGFGVALLLRYASVAWNYISNSKRTAKAQIYKNKEDIIKIQGRIDQHDKDFEELKSEGSSVRNNFDTHKTEMSKLATDLFEKFEQKVESFEAKVELKIDNMTKEIIKALLDKIKIGQ